MKMKRLRINRETLRNLGESRVGEWRANDSGCSCNATCITVLDSDNPYSCQQSCVVITH